MHHDTVKGIEALTYALELSPQKIMSDQKIHDLCSIAVTQGITNTIKEFIETNLKYKNK